MITYSDISKMVSFIDRYRALKLSGVVGEVTFGSDRYLNQILYKSWRWRDGIRPRVILRDGGCDLGIDGYEIKDMIIIHHINPITIEDIKNNSDKVFNPDNLICVSHMTHMAIHYGDESLLPSIPVSRFPGDTCPWKVKGR